MAIIATLLYLVLGVGSVFLIGLILLQRGRGGGLAGALGGMGGYSAFGTRAGDVFTKITIIAASAWILAAMALAWINAQAAPKYTNPEAASQARPAAAAEQASQSGQAGTATKRPGSAGPKQPAASPAQSKPVSGTPDAANR